MPAWKHLLCFSAEAHTCEQQPPDCCRKAFIGSWNSSKSTTSQQKVWIVKLLLSVKKRCTSPLNLKTHVLILFDRVTFHMCLLKVRQCIRYCILQPVSDRQYQQTERFLKMNAHSGLNGPNSAPFGLFKLSMHLLILLQLFPLSNYHILYCVCVGVCGTYPTAVRTTACAKVWVCICQIGNDEMRVKVHISTHKVHTSPGFMNRWLGGWMDGIMWFSPVE